MLNQNVIAMMLRYLVIGCIAGTDCEISWCDSLDDAIQVIRKSSVDDQLLSYRIETYQLSSSLSCRIIDRQLFIE